MNKREREMLGILQFLQQNGSVAVKAEFEAEGTRVEEFLRLLELGRKASLGVALKIGGCEAIRDLIEAKQFGVDYIIAPMIESGYALKKYIAAKNKVFTPEEREDIKFLFNVETHSAFEQINTLVDIANEQNGVDGIVFGRVDFAGSLDIDRDKINTSEITSYANKVATKCKQKNLEFVIGGAISVDALDVLKEIERIKLNRFETRKIIFSGDSVHNATVKDCLLKAVHFELLWLLNKSEYYGFIESEDKKRIEMLNARWNIL